MQVFGWRAFDVRGLLPAGWDDKVLAVALQENTLKEIRPPHVTSREAPDVESLTIRGVGADVVRAKLPWMTDLYHGSFKELAQIGQSEAVRVADGKRHTVVMNVQLGTDMRYESHVDTNPIQGLLYVTNQPEGTGGELVVSRLSGGRSREDIDADPVMIYPQRGHLVFFDARFHPHYIRVLNDENDVRVAVAFNYYVPSCPESRRPNDLDDYLYGRRVS